MTSLDECMQARIGRAHSFYLGIDDFAGKLSILAVYAYNCREQMSVKLKTTLFSSLRFITNSIRPSWQP